MTVRKFKEIVYRNYARYARGHLPWRNTHNPYYILVSEIMLQQTQVSRVIEKYRAFILRFPTVKALARASLRQVMEVWQGLGYNRRALALKKLSEKIILEYKGKIPSERQALKALPGIGEATSGAVCAFAFNKPVVFIETNIRSVFIHHFFKGRYKVSDGELLACIEKALDRENPRTWYYALMDYGVYLKGRHPNPSRKSLHYRAQSPFKNSDRSMRGKIIKLLLAKKRASEASLCRLTADNPQRFNKILGNLLKEGLIKQQGRFLHIA